MNLEKTKVKSMVKLLHLQYVQYLTFTSCVKPVCLRKCGVGPSSIGCCDKINNAQMILVLFQCPADMNKESNDMIIQLSTLKMI